MPPTHPPATPPTSGFVPTYCGDVELAAPLTDLAPIHPVDGAGYRRGSLLVRLHTHPLAVVTLDLPDGGLSATALAEEIWTRLGTQIAAHLMADGRPAVCALPLEGLGDVAAPACLSARADTVTNAPLISVIVPTREHPDVLAPCLNALLQQDYPTYEILVVDSGPQTDRTAQTTVRYAAQAEAQGCSLVYVRVGRAGSSLARNVGLATARGDILAFVDDDAVADRHWLAEIAAGFAAVPTAGCVTGNVLPRELETQAQAWFEEYGGFSKGYAVKVFDTGAHRPRSILFPFAAGRFGSGNNMAFRRECLERLGGFDETMGVGTLTRSGEDLSIFYHTIRQGYAITYRPGAIVRHRHRRDYVDLYAQMYAYGLGMSAYILQCLVTDPRAALQLAWKVPAGAVYAFSSRSARNKAKSAAYPAALTAIERRGLWHGPRSYLRSLMTTTRSHAPVYVKRLTV